MKRLLVTLVIFAGFLVVPFIIAQAQGPLEFDHMQIDIWPEYDQPATLIIYKITLPASTTMPAQVSLRIPKAVGLPASVAMQDVDGLLYNLTYTATTEGDWGKISFTAPSPTLQIEYYDPGLVKNGASRSYQYTWPGDYKVNDMVIRIQQPINATQMTILPTQGLSSVGNDGLTYFGNDVGAVAVGTTFTFKISYNKPDDKLSASSITVQSPTPINSTSQSGSGGLFQGLNMVMIVAIAGVVLIGGGVTWFFLQRRSQDEPVRRRHAAFDDSPLKSSVKASAGGAVYCHQCGKRAAAEDVFCRGCGARLHS